MSTSEAFENLNNKLNVLANKLLMPILNYLTLSKKLKNKRK